MKLPRESFHKLPNNFLQKLKKLYPERFDRIIETFLEKKTPSFRVNYGKTDLVSLRRKLISEGVRFKELDFPKGAFLLKTPQRHLQQTESYRKGWIYLQNVSSMLPPLLLAPERDENVLDLCAAPGAKTTQIFSLAPQARIVAFEKSRVRYYKLLANIKTQGAGNAIKVYLDDATRVRRKFPEYFDKILADVPCTTEGRFWVGNPRTYKYWTDKKVKEMVRTQKKLLYASFYALKPGGVLVYSTCTISPEENEGMISWAIEKFKDQLEVEKIEMSLPNVEAGFLKFREQKFDSQAGRSRRILPNDYMEAFFVAKLRKL